MNQDTIMALNAKAVELGSSGQWMPSLPSKSHLNNLKGSLQRHGMIIQPCQFAEMKLPAIALRPVLTYEVDTWK